MKELFIDIETYAEVDLAKVGVYRYATDSSFEILLFAYSVDGKDIKVVDLAQGEVIPPSILEALTDSYTKVYSFNCNFERVCLSSYLGLPVGKYLKAKNKFYCTMIHSAYLGLPLSLEKVGYVLELDKKKLDVGKTLINYFCKPCEPTKSNGGRTRNRPSDAIDKWNSFKEYSYRDVEALVEIHKRLSKLPVPDYVWNIYHLNEDIQDYGIRTDLDFVNHATNIDKLNTEQNLERATELTGLDNFNSPQQLKNWLIEQNQCVDSLAKADIKRLLEGASGHIEEALKLRQELSKTSNKKYTTIQNCVCSDFRIRGTSQFYGSHTGRFAGRLLQTANMVANHLDDLDGARSLVINEDVKAIQAKYGSISNTLSELIRTSLIPSNGNRFIVADFSQVENRVAAYIVKSKYLLDAYKNGEDIYCTVASKLFNKTVTKTNENSNYRKYGKICCLALNYGGGVAALKAFGALAMGIKETELQSIVTNYRMTNPEIVKAWWTIDKVAKSVIRTGESESCYGFEFSYERGILFIKLPSGRKLAYCKPRLGINNFGSECIKYEGVGNTHKWELLETYGPRLFENIVQAYAADLLYEAMDRVTKKGYQIVLTVHDELVCDIPTNESSVEEICSLMSEAPSWAPDILLRADGYVAPNYYFKE